MKNFLRKVGKILFFITYIFFVAASVGLASLFIIKNNEFLKNSEEAANLKNQLSQTSAGINQSSEESRGKINELDNELNSLRTKNNELENTVKEYQKDGEGIIEGKILGQIVLGQDNLSQFQLVCAQNTANVNEIYCKSVSAITQTFEISLPAGIYTVYSKVLSKDNQIVLETYSGKYTDYVKCLTEKASPNCDVNLSKKQITIEVKPMQKIVNINPVDWN